MKRTYNNPSKVSQLALAAGIALLSASAWGAAYPGWAKVDIFEGVTGGIAGLQSSSKFTNNQPDLVTFVDRLYWSRNPGADNYGARISGYITPLETADYVFFLAADDNVSLYLSTDSSPANLKLVAADQGWQNSRQWVGPGGTSSGENTTNVVFRRGFNPGPTVLEQNGYQWVGPFENRSDQFLKSPRTNLLTGTSQPWPTLDASGQAKIHLTAGTKYYFEVLYNEGTGGENVGVAWKKATDPDPANGDPEIMGDVLSVDYGTSLTFYTQPKSQSVNQNQPTTFSVFVVGVPGDSDQTMFTYEWLVNGQPVADQPNAPSYTIQAPTLADSGKKYSVKVTTSGGIVGTSAEALLTVSSDNVPPTVAKIQTAESFDSIKITFSEGVRDEAANTANYQFSGGLQVTDANFVIVINDPLNPENPKSPTNPSNRVAVILMTSKQTEGAVYDLTMSNIKDITGNAMVANRVKAYANVFKAGILNLKRWFGGNNIGNLFNDPLRLANPAVQELRTVAESGAGVSGTYVDRLSGFFIPTVTTNYVFLMSADNDGYLYLSTDADPANRKMIAADVGWQNSREWTGPGGDTAKRRGDRTGNGPFENRSDQMLTSQRAINNEGFLNGVTVADGTEPEPWPTLDASGNAVITLTAGTRYAFQLWHTEGDSGRFEATFKYVGEPDPANGTASRITSQYIGAYVDPTSLAPLITTQPTNINFNAGDTLTFNVVVDSALPATYQWYKNAAAITNATNATLVITSATAAALGSYYVGVTNANGGVVSATVAALVSVPDPLKKFQQDTAGTTVIEAEHYYNATRSPDGHMWAPGSGRAGNSGTGYMAALPDSGANNNTATTQTNGPALNFRIVFAAAGTNYVWLRGADPLNNGNGDSIHAALDGVIPVSATRIDGAPTFGVATGWNWVGNIQGDTRAFVVVPTAGEHTFSLYMREDGILIDKVLLTTDAAFTPTDTGPAESAEVGSVTRPSLSTTRNAAGAPVINYTGTLESAAAPGGPWTTVSGATGGTYTPNVQSAQQQFYRSKL